MATETERRSTDEQQEPVSSPSGYILELYFPLTQVLLPTDYETEHDAVRGALAHFRAFPRGYAQIRHVSTNRVILNHQQLYCRRHG